MHIISLAVGKNLDLLFWFVFKWICFEKKEKDTVARFTASERHSSLEDECATRKYTNKCDRNPKHKSSHELANYKESSMETCVDDRVSHMYECVLKFRI